MKKFHYRWSPLLIALTIIFLHFMFFSVWGYPLTIAPFALFGFILINYLVALKGSWGWSVFLLLFPFINLILSMLGGGNPDVAHYFRTYALWSYAALSILIAFKSPITKNIGHNSWSLERIALVCLVILCTFSVAQVMIFLGLGSDILYNIFGEHQYIKQYEISRFASDDVLRATGLYLEPSFNAFVVISLHIICLLARFRLWHSSVLTLLALFVIQSMAGLIAFIAIWGLIALNVHFGKAEAALKLWSKLSIANLVLVLVIAYSGGVLGTSTGLQKSASRLGIAYYGEGACHHNHVKTPCAVDIANGISRFKELGVPTSSAYYRIVAPLKVLKDVLVNEPLGEPFGQIEKTLRGYNLLSGGEKLTSLDNGIYILVFYFGWAGIAFLAFLIYRLMKSLFRPAGINELILLTYILLSLPFSGGIMSPEYVFMLVMILYQFRVSSPFESFAKAMPVSTPLNERTS